MKGSNSFIQKKVNARNFLPHQAQPMMPVDNPSKVIENIIDKESIYFPENLKDSDIQDLIKRIKREFSRFSYTIVDLETKYFLNIYYNEVYYKMEYLEAQKLRWSFIQSSIEKDPKLIKLIDGKRFQVLSTIDKIIKWIDEKINEVGPTPETSEEVNSVNHVTNGSKIKSVDSLPVKEIALIHVFNEKQITRKNAGEIASKFGFKSVTSGEGLFQDYTFFSSLANRKGRPIPCTPKKLKNKIQLFERVIKHLSGVAKKRAQDELKMLEIIYESEFS